MKPPKLSTAPALRWVERQRWELFVLEEIRAVVLVPNSEDIVDGILWYLTGNEDVHFAFSLPEARRAAEKALGIPFDVEVM